MVMSSSVMVAAAVSSAAQVPEISMVSPSPVSASANAAARLSKSPPKAFTVIVAIYSLIQSVTDD